MVGGGRWARVYARVLSKLPDLVSAVTVVSPHNAAGMRQWIDAERLDYRVTGALDPSACDAAIIVNAAADHESSAVQFLEAGIPALVEKPFALSAAGAARMIETAQARNVYLAAALVFRFAAYIDRFAALLPAAWERLSVTWTDPADESRYGERKSHDPKLPMAADVLPHVVSILDTLAPHATIACRSVAADQGGAEVEIELSLNGRPCLVHLGRNAEKRVRLIQAAAGAQRCELDFSTEPGRITREAGSESGDPDWAGRPSPLTQLVRCFLEGLQGARDRRLVPRLGLLACQLTDEALGLH